MPRTREELEQIERQTLAPYAQFSGDTRGRKHAEAPLTASVLEFILEGLHVENRLNKSAKGGELTYRR